MVDPVVANNIKNKLVDTDLFICLLLLSCKVILLLGCNIVARRDETNVNTFRGVRRSGCENN